MRKILRDVRGIVEKAVDMRNAGKNNREIAAALGLARSTFLDIVSKDSINKNCPELLEQFYCLEKIANNKIERMRLKVLQVIEARQTGKTMEDIAKTMKMTTSALFGLTAERNIKRHCPDLTAPLRESLNKTNGICNINKEIDGLVKELQSGTDIAVICKRKDLSAKTVRAAMVKTFHLGIGVYCEYVEDVLNGDEEPPNIPKCFDFFNVHKPKGGLKTCGKCGKEEQRLFKFVKEIIDGERVFYKICRECLCADDPEVNLLHDLMTRHQVNSKNAESEGL